MSNKKLCERCPECKRENYALNVLSGICTWCGWDVNKNDYCDGVKNEKS
jgi:hypothetical protein